MASNSPALDAAQMVINAGIGYLNPTGNNFAVKVGRLKATPVPQIAFVDSPGQRPNPKWLLDYPHLQCLVRGTPDEYLVAYNKAKEVKDLLLGMDPVVQTTGDRWDGVTMLSDLAMIGYDENSCPIFSLNFRIILEPAASNSPLSDREPL